MGYDAPCTLRFDGRSTRGTAHLEQHDLVFRGGVRLAVPLKAITSVRADSGCLAVTWEGGTADFIVGSHADKWADRIVNPPSRLDKLGVKAGLSVRIVAVADAGFIEEIRRRGARILRRAGARPADLLFYGAERRKALDRLPKLIDAIAPNGSIWILRPKGRREITDADVRAAAKHAGLVDVKVVSFSDTHTAEKLVIPVAKRAALDRPQSPPPRARESPSRRDRI